MSIHVGLFLLIMTICGAFGGFFLKKGSQSISSFKKIVTNKHLYVGGGLYCIGAIINIILLRSIPYNIILPLNSITYIWTLFLAYFILKEKISKNKMVGICFIILGLYIML